MFVRKLRFQVSGVGCQEKEMLDTETLYEFRPKWHVFLVIRLAAAMAWIEQRTAEYRITNNEFRRIESLRSISLLKKIEYIPSTFDVGRWMFDVHQFLFRLDRLFFGRRLG